MYVNYVTPILMNAPCILYSLLSIHICCPFVGLDNKVHDNCFLNFNNLHLMILALVIHLFHLPVVDPGFCVNGWITCVDGVSKMWRPVEVCTSWANPAGIENLCTPSDCFTCTPVTVCCCCCGVGPRAATGIAATQMPKTITYFIPESTKYISQHVMSILSNLPVCYIMGKT